MAIPVLKLNLVPAPSAWRSYHDLIGWSLLGGGLLSAALVATFTVRSYLQANRIGRQAVVFSRQAHEAATRESRIQDELRNIDVPKEQPRWRLAERILSERSLPWSRITAELERSLVQDIRLRSIQRVRAAGNLGVQIKLKGEARTREAEEALIDSFRQNAFFLTPVFEREAERTGGGVEFDLTLPVSPVPLPYEPLPKFGPGKKVAAAPPSAPPSAAPSTPPGPARPRPARKEVRS
jgi:hypothetical protein